MKSLLLLSSGIDSPVAGHLASGILYALYFSQKDNKALSKVKKLARKIKVKKLFVADHLLIMKEIATRCQPKFTCVLCRRFMYRIASQLAEREGCEFIIDGGNLGQVASQTLDNIILTAKVADVPLLRPLLCNEKQETIDIAKKIGTYELSSEKDSGCRFVPKYPVTRSNEKALLAQEKRLEKDEIIKKVFASVKIVS